MEANTKPQAMKKVQEALDDTYRHDLYPFFWQHGEPEEVLLDVLNQMEAQNIQNFCVESRPHPEFLEEGWWKAMDFLLAEARKRNMKVWILDDAKFPTGFANGTVPEPLKKHYLKMKRLDVTPQSSMVSVDVSQLEDFRQAMKNPAHRNDQLYRVFLAENLPDSRDAFNAQSLQEVTDHVSGPLLNLSLEPGKNYSVFLIYSTSVGDEEATSQYLDPMLPEGTDCLLKEVYEKHYEHYKDDFGQTIQAFFFDEPRFGNTKGPNAIIGRFDMPIPWNSLVEAKLNEAGFDWNQLPLLFTGEGELAGAARNLYMDIITRLYEENFSRRIAKWCHEHGVWSVGHVIEDNNAHQRLGYGPGHYFRAIAGQDVAGVDIIGGQVVPGMNFNHAAFSTGGSDGEFYHYTLCRLGQSAALLDPQKEGRLMCEAYGAYGWIEGLRMMKWITDHMISRGVNYIVPHAFNPKAFPDWDCAPHFYARGNNPQYPYFHHLMDYASRLTHLFQGGRTHAKAGVLYTAPAEWSGDAMQLQSVLKELEQHQIPFAIISEDWLDEAVENQSPAKDDGTKAAFFINGVPFETLIVPQAQYLPAAILEKLNQLDTPVYFMNALPENSDANSMLNNVQPLALDKLADTLQEYAFVKTETPQPLLVCHAVDQPDGRVVMLVNEDLIQPIDTRIEIPFEGDVCQYDAMTSTLLEIENVDRKKPGVIAFDLHLEPYQPVVLVNARAQVKPAQIGPKLDVKPETVGITLKPYDHSTPISRSCTPENGQLPLLHLEYPQFSGTADYDFDVELEQPCVLLDLKEAYETAEVLVNGQSAGIRIAPPYRFDLSQYAKAGSNHITIRTATNLARAVRDGLSQYVAMEPIGLLALPDWFALEN